MENKIQHTGLSILLKTFNVPWLTDPRRRHPIPLNDQSSTVSPLIARGNGLPFALRWRVFGEAPHPDLNLSSGPVNEEVTSIEILVQGEIRRVGNWFRRLRLKPRGVRLVGGFAFRIGGFRASTFVTQKHVWYNGQIYL